MTETLTESFCERCGTRYEFKAPTRLNPLRKTRGFIGGLKNYLTSQDDMSDAMRDAMRQEEEALAAAQLEAFHESFNFCIDCRQYTCVNCWNDAAGRCRSCVPIPGTDDLAERLAASVAANGAVAVAEPVLAEDEFQRRMGFEGWPSSDLAAEGLQNGHPADVTWPGADVVEPEPVVAEEPEPEPVVTEEPEPVVAEEPEAEPVVAEEPQPEPVVAEEAPRLRVVTWEPDTAYEILEPEPVVAEEPEPVVAEEPEPVVAEEPEPMVAEEPEPMVAQEPEPVVAEEPQPVLAEEPEPMVAQEPEPVVAEEPEPVLAEEPEPMVAEEPEPMVAEEPEPVLAEEPEPMVAEEPEPAQRIAPISETILRFPAREPDAAPEPGRQAAEQESPEVAARRAQLDLLGLGDPGEGPVDQGRPSVLPYRSRGATPSAAELATRAGRAGGSGFWEASAREVAGAAATIGVQNCGQCGLSLSANARFCRRCGTRQARSA